MRNLWCSILPLIISPKGIVQQSFFKNLKILDLGNTLVVEIQKGILLYSLMSYREEVLKHFDFLGFSSIKLSSLIWCIVGCRIPSDEIFAEKYETKIMKKLIFMDPTLCFIFHFV
jgi:hypothetical protein